MTGRQEMEQPLLEVIEDTNTDDVATTPTTSHEDNGGDTTTKKISRSCRRCCSCRCTCVTILLITIGILSYIFWFLCCPAMKMLDCSDGDDACFSINQLNEKYFDGGPYALYEDNPFWGDAVTIQTLVDYAENSGECDDSCSSMIENLVSAVHRRRSSLIVKQFSFASWPSSGYEDASYDDPLWWSLLYLNAGRVFDNHHFVDTSRIIFDWVYEKSWNASPINCDGGMCWEHEQGTAKNSDCYKNSITNELAFTVASGLHLSGRMKDDTYLTTAMEIYDWFESGFLNNDLELLISDFVGNECKSTPDYAPWSYTQGVVLNGLVNLYSISGDAKYLSTSIKLVNGVMELLVEEKAGLKVLKEIAGVVDRDGQLFKGIFVRNLQILLKEVSERVR